MFQWAGLDEATGFAGDDIGPGGRMACWEGNECKDYVKRREKGRVCISTSTSV